MLGYVFQKTQGNPLLSIELVQYMLDERLLAIEDGVCKLVDATVVCPTRRGVVVVAVAVAVG